MAVFRFGIVSLLFTAANKTPNCLAVVSTRATASSPSSLTPGTDPSGSPSNS